MRMNAWYVGGGLAPEPELSRWRLHPEAELRKLSRELLEGTWEPQTWLQVPYPKKNRSLRHYVLPTVRDQVAFMAHLVLLGPFLDEQVHSFAFGNRWYRPMLWNRRRPTPKWENRPYPFSTSRIYLPYSRSHGLFRRAAHWTVAQMTERPVRMEDYAGRVQHFDDYGEDSLPPWTRGEWWSGSGGERAFWAALDIQMAYPSVLLGRLGLSMERMLGDTCKDPRHLLQGFPEAIIQALGDAGVRGEIAGRLAMALGKVEVAPGPIPASAWKLQDPHWLPELEREGDTGLPTGLAVSGMLLNVALHDADSSVESYLKETSGDRRGALVRFADDMYVMSKSVEGILGLVDAVDIALAGSEGGALAAPNVESNLCLNFGKLRPEPIQIVVGAYLEASGWAICPTCEEPVPPDEWSVEVGGILEWWDGLADSERDSYRSDVDRTGIGKGDVGPFVTALVERLSELGTDTLEDRFGDGARRHIARLHELARFEIDDEQVRPETRRTFSANRLVRAWAPADMESQVVRDIRETVASVLGSTPWQANVWRAVVRAAVRRPRGAVRAGDRDAADWLCLQLRRIALRPEATDWLAWENVWPEPKQAHERDGWRSHYLSFHRAAFWRAVAEALRDLGRHEERYGKGSAEQRDASPNDWTVRAVPEGAHGDAADWLGRLDDWAGVLYGGGRTAVLRDWAWEVDALAEAVLSSQRSSTVAEAWRKAATAAGGTLRVPAMEGVPGIRLCAELLEELGRQVPVRPVPQRKLGADELAHVRFGQPDSSLAAVLFPREERARVVGGTPGRRRTAVMAALVLGCFADVRLRWAQSLMGRAANRASVFREEPLALREYGRARPVVVGQVVYKRPATLHRVLWGRPESAPLAQWPLRAWETPALGLPTAVAIKLFATARKQEAPAGWTALDGPLNWAIRDARDMLARTRQRQLGRHSSSRRSGRWLGVDGDNGMVVTRSRAWELPPHEAFYLPFAALCGERHSEEVHDASYLLYCDVLLLLTALDGQEGILDELAQRGAGEGSFEDRWGWRSRIHLSASAWGTVEKVLRWSERPHFDETDVGVRLVVGLEAGVIEGNVVDPVVERIDVGLRVGGDEELVRGLSQGTGTVPDLPPALRSGGELAEEFVVRVGQVTAWPRMAEVVSRFPGMGWNTAAAVMSQVASMFDPSGEGTHASRPELVLLPESTVPHTEAPTLRRLVGQKGIASLAGLYWRPLWPAYRPAGGRLAGWRCFVNEAELAVPEGFGDRGPTTVRWFRVRKPVPAHIEDGLAMALTLRDPGVVWTILPGYRWYRFVHPRWGDFTIAICADLIDAEPWRLLRGELLHLLMVAHNRDVDLYDALTWVRAYENYVNVASVNHGQFGGSFVWTPRHAHGRELAKLRGGGLFLKADVRLPVKALRLAQREGVRDAVIAAAAKWQASTESDPGFKAPPPGFVAGAR